VAHTLFILNDAPYGTERTDTTRRSSLEQLADWAQWADRTLVF
jgi:hypothetical protein